MKKQLAVHTFSGGAESDGFVAALASTVLVSRRYTEDTPYWCSPKGSYCIHCGNCHIPVLSRHRAAMYHSLLTASGMAFTFDYPEDDSVPFHTMPGIPAGWRWDEPFLSDVMDFAGLSYTRHSDKTVPEIRELVKETIDAGYPALIANHGVWVSEAEWSTCWNIVCGYTDNGISVMHHGGAVTEEADGAYGDVIIVTGTAARRQTYRDVLRRIYRVLTDPSHDLLEQEIYRDLSNINPDNAAGMAYKMMGINGVPTESRWHAAEAFCSCDNLLSSLTDDKALKSRLSDLFFSRYIADNNNETHGIGWKIWGCLNVGPSTGYMPTEESFALIQKPEVQEELRRLYGSMFGNDRAVAEGIRAELDRI